MKIVLATTNPGKIAEIKAVLDMSGVEWLTYDQRSGWPEVKEDGRTFLENATSKAGSLADYFNLPALADDSGLEVEALDGGPGIYSARFAGPNAVDADNIAKLLHEMRDAPEAARKARFVAVVVLAWPDGRTISATGICSGSIGMVPCGERGFGYDPVFIPEGYDRTMAKLTLEEKNSLSHRGKALRALRRELDVILSPRGEGPQGEGPKG